MKATYLKIASFFWKENTLLNFYVDYKSGEDPFGTFSPTAYSGSLEHSVFGIHNRPPIDFKPVWGANINQVFKDFGHCDYLSDEMTFAISASMCFYYCQQTSQVFNLEIFNEFYSLEKYDFSNSHESLTLPTYLDPFYISPSDPTEKHYKLNRPNLGEKELDWSKVHNFFTDDDYVNYSVFAENLEKIVNLNSELKGLFKGFDEILLAELALKNIGRPHFVGIDSYSPKLQHRFFSSKMLKKSIELSEVILNNNCLRDAFNLSLIENIPCSNSLFSLSTHIDYSDDEKGNYSIKYNLPVSQNEVLGSNFSINFSDNDLIEVNLKQVMRYSQNYIQYKYSNDTNQYPTIDFGAIREFYTPIFPIDYEVEYNHFENLVNSNPNLANYFKSGGRSPESKIDYRYSYLYQFLKDKKVLSNRFIEYCKYLHNISFTAENIYEEDQKLVIPFWEIPRMQQIVIENYLIKFMVLQCEEEDYESEFENDYSLKEDRGHVNDGLSDFYDVDPDWHWNID